VYPLYCDILNDILLGINASDAKEFFGDFWCTDSTGRGAGRVCSIDE
jgi:hypothetical protein